MLIGEAAEAVGVTSQALRFYERRGLLPRARRRANGYRTYDEVALTRLRFITMAQAAGLTLSQIRGILDLRDKGTTPCAHVAALVESKVADVRARIEQLSALQAELEVLRRRSHELDPDECGDTDICHILSSPP